MSIEFLPNFTSKSVEKPKKIKNKGFNRAYFAQSAFQTAASLPLLAIPKIMQKVSALSPEDSKMLMTGAQKGLETSGLKSNGVKINTISVANLKDTKDKVKNFAKDLIKLIKGKENSSQDFLQATSDLLNTTASFTPEDDSALNAIKAEIKNNRQFKKIFGNFKKISTDGDFENIFLESAAKSAAMPFRLGKNACFLPNANQVIIPDSILQTSVFHEMGHALNRNKSSIMRTMQKLRPLALTVPPLILFLSLINKTTVKKIDEKKETKENKNDTPIKKGMDFVKKHAPELAFLASVPQILEEGAASLKGEKIARGLVKTGDLSKQIFKRIKLTNLVGFSSYLLVGIIAAASIKFAIKIKDGIQEKYEEKLSKKQ